MKFHPNNALLFVLAAAVILFVIAQSVFFLVCAYRRGKELGIDPEKMRKTMLSTAIKRKIHQRYFSRSIHHAIFRNLLTYITNVNRKRGTLT